jgi:hypothetical protein
VSATGLNRPFGAMIGARERAACAFYDKPDRVW